MTSKAKLKTLTQHLQTETACEILNAAWNAPDFFTQFTCTFYFKIQHPSLLAGFNPFQKYQSNWIISPSSGENTTYLKPPPSSPLNKKSGLSFVSMDPFIFELTRCSTWLTSVVPKKRSQSNIDQSSYLNLFESFWHFSFVALVLPSPFKPIHPWSLTWNLKISPWKSRIPLWFRHHSLHLKTQWQSKHQSPQSSICFPKWLWV